MKRTVLILLFISPSFCYTVMPAFNALHKIVGPTMRVKINSYVQEKAREHVLQSIASNNNNVSSQHTQFLEQWKLQFKIDKK